MLEYASILEMLFCLIAARFPQVMVTMAITARARDQLRLRAIAPITITRKAAAKPAFFVPAASNAAIVGGAPSYVSGSHMWKGTRPILNPNPAMNIPTASMASGNRSGLRCENPFITCSILVEPVRPYAIDIPQRIIPEDSAPNKKYLMAASFEVGSFL